MAKKKTPKAKNKKKVSVIKHDDDPAYKSRAVAVEDEDEINVEDEVDEVGFEKEDSAQDEEAI